jgi:hypothetical protein
MKLKSMPTRHRNKEKETPIQEGIKHQISAAGYALRLEQIVALLQDVVG